MADALRGVIDILKRSTIAACIVAFVWGAWGGISADAQTTQRIAAIVNDEIVSGYDLRSRTDLIILSSRLPDTQEVRERIAPQVLRTLIDDRLRLQEARRLKLTVSEQEIASAVREIEERNQMKPGDMYALLERSNVDRSTFRLQIEAELAWRKVIGNQVRASVNIGDEAVDDAIQRIEANKGKPEYLVSEIFLSMSAGRSADETRQIAGRLRQQIAEGANFAALAQSFSQSASAATGGNLGWVREDQLDPELADAIKELQPGTVSLPIQGIDGFYVLLLRNRRISQGVPVGDVSMTLQQIFLPLAPGMSEVNIAAKEERAREISKAATSCADMEAAGKELGSPQSGQLANVKLASLPAPIQNAVDGLKNNQGSEPIRVGEGVVVLMVCERSGDNNGEIRERVRGMLVQERAELIARRMLRDLHRSALVDIRR